jgi:cysteinyl-tRNA synthetase
MTKNLNLFNTLSRKKEEFMPIDYNKIGMYVCGPTVYDFPHIGNARPLVVFDVLYRLLLKIYGKNKITYVRNITDVDDKIIESSKKNKQTIKEFLFCSELSFLEVKIRPGSRDDLGRPTKAPIENKVSFMKFIEN